MKIKSFMLIFVSICTLTICGCSQKSPMDEPWYQQIIKNGTQSRTRRLQQLQEAINTQELLLDEKKTQVSQLKHERDTLINNINLEQERIKTLNNTLDSLKSKLNQK